MIYLFTGNNDYLVREKVSSWKKLFITKNGEFDLFHFKDISSSSENEISSTLTGTSLFESKKLIIIDDLPLSGSTKNKGLSDKQDYILPLLDKIPENNIVIFSSGIPDKRSKFYKALIKIAEVKIFETKNDHDLVELVSKKYSGKITKLAIDLIIKYKGSNYSKIISELDKLFITYDHIDDKIIKEHIIPELEESIFQVIDDILNKDIYTAFKKIDIILNDTVIYAFYNNLLSNLRTNIYISKLKSMGINSNVIGDTLGLGNRGFLVNKNYKLSYKSLSKLYINLVNLDKKMKSGLMSGTEEKDFKYELEKVILSIL